MTSLIDSRRLEKDKRKAARLNLLAERGNLAALEQLTKVEEIKTETKKPVKKETKKENK